ncbi:hypothetical protein [Geobacillus phage TP-84]|uniref:Uncharacterized protein n=1 Tax=Geobacillus phage TP-84 TaxID=1965361 RepID=A0A1U9WQQ5_9CAUD|nr:hypothetical protein MUK65_gp75 [Geobacillus phage TP-84]AQY55092.1 hypothetical protein [Geobacillus phage TP-84]
MVKCAICGYELTIDEEIEVMLADDDECPKCGGGLTVE